MTYTSPTEAEFNSPEVEDLLAKGLAAVGNPVYRAIRNDKTFDLALSLLWANVAIRHQVPMTKEVATLLDTVIALTIAAMED